MMAVDFGAARELLDGEQFESLVGTPEYHHPTLFASAYLRRRIPQNKCGEEVDLWSIGATLYHISTGELPFQPYGGVRINTETHHEMETKKGWGVISAVQKHGPNSEIIYHHTLPPTCPMSSGLQEQIVPIIANLMEVNPMKQLNFDRFFEVTTKILSNTSLWIFDTSRCDLRSTYLDDFSMDNVLQSISKLCSIDVSQLLLIFDGHTLDAGSSGLSNLCARIGVQRPIFSYGRNTNEEESEYVTSSSKHLSQIKILQEEIPGLSDENNEVSPSLLPSRSFTKLMCYCSMVLNEYESNTSLVFTSLSYIRNHIEQCRKLLSTVLHGISGKQRLYEIIIHQLNNSITQLRLAQRWDLKSNMKNGEVRRLEEHLQEHLHIEEKSLNICRNTLSSMDISNLSVNILDSYSSTIFNIEEFVKKHAGEASIQLINGRVAKIKNTIQLFKDKCSEWESIKTTNYPPSHMKELQQTIRKHLIELCNKAVDGTTSVIVDSQHVYNEVYMLHRRCITKLLSTHTAIETELKSLEATIDLSSKELYEVTKESHNYDINSYVPEDSVSTNCGNKESKGEPTSFVKSLQERLYEAQKINEDIKQYAKLINGLSCSPALKKYDD